MSTTRFGFALLVGAVLLLSGIRTSADEQPKEKLAKGPPKEFVYPGAKQLGEEREGAGMYLGKFTTSADAAKVAAWYKKAVGFEEEKGIIITEGISFKQPGIRLSLVDDSRHPAKGKGAVDEPRPLTLHVLVKKTDDILVVAVVSRGQDEKLTHVALTFMNFKAP